jgi:tetratricopeptide (TPR) repeat protein
VAEETLAAAVEAIASGELHKAKPLLDHLVAKHPDWAEAWNKRATLYYMRNDYAHALADIREVLAREPRHFGALAGLGMIMRDIGDDKKALAAFRQALKQHPHLDNIPDLVKSLSDKVEGRDI